MFHTPGRYRSWKHCFRLNEGSQQEVIHTSLLSETQSFKKDCRKYLALFLEEGANMAEKNPPAGSDRKALVTIHTLAATSRGS